MSVAEGEPGVLRPLTAPRTLVEDATDLIRSGILSGGFRPGERLVEAKLAAELNVSRGTVREALRALRGEGLVGEEARRGLFVVEIDAGDVNDGYELRAIVEERAARRIARARRPEVLDELRRLFLELEAAVQARDASAISVCDLAFHEAICRLSGNPRLHEVFVRYVPMLRRLLPLDEQVLTSLDEVVDQHRAILSALEHESPERAGRVCERHCAEAAKLLVAHLEQASAPEAT